LRVLVFAVDVALVPDLSQAFDVMHVDSLGLLLPLDGTNVHAMLEQRAVLAGEVSGVLERNVRERPITFSRCLPP
jgi:hypothetical protein